MDFTKNQGQEVLSPYHDELHACLRVAWKKWQTIAHLFPDPLPRTRANIVYQFAIDEGKRLLGQKRGAHWVKSRGRHLLNISDLLVVGFKKLNETLGTNNYPTLSALLYDAQLDLEGIPSRIPRLTVGYRLKNFDTEIDHFVVYSIEKRVQWWYELQPQAQTNVTPFPVSSLEPPHEEAQVRVRESNHKEETKKKKQSAKR